MEKKQTNRRVDRRTIYTKNVIKDALLELLAQTSFEKITVASLCRQAEIVRTTFYLHYDNITDVVKDLADDAILAAAEHSSTNLADIQILAKQMQQTTDPELLAPYMSLLPVCQQVADDEKYRVLFQDPMVAEYILMQIYRQKKTPSVEQFRSRFGISEKQAEKLFLFVITGAFEVNKSMGWEKSQDWYEVQKVLLAFISAGYEALEKLS